MHLEVDLTSQTRPEQRQDTRTDSQCPENVNVKPTDKHTMKSSRSINLLPYTKTDTNIMIPSSGQSGTG